MAIDTNKLVVDSTLQDYLVDKDTGLPLSNGVLTFYRDNSRTTLKNVYQQQGTAGSYTYVVLPNPLTLSAVGTVVDNSGNDTKILYYPYSETDSSIAQPYYITVDDEDGERQFTRQNWPILPTSDTPTNSNPSLNNLLTNNVFWRNIGSVTLTNSLQSTLAPSQHDGFIYPDIQFFKDATGAVDVATFQTFDTVQVLPADVTPEYYLNLTCSGTGAETYKYIQIPIQLHVKNLSDYKNSSVVLQTRLNSGASTVIIKLLQYLGTGVVSPAADTIVTINSNSSWTRTVAPFDFLDSSNLTLGNGGDDAWYLQIYYPAGQIFNIDIAKPSLYLNETPSTDDFQTYDQANAIFSSPRTGDVRTSLNTYQFGFVPMSDGTICNVGSITPPTNVGISRQNKDTWQLYNFIWNAFKDYDHGGINLIAQMYDDSGVTTGYGATAIADFNSLKQISLTKSLGRVLLGTAPFSSLYTQYVSSTAGSNSGGNLLLTATDSMNLYNGIPVKFINGTLPNALSSNVIYYVANFNAGAKTFNVSTTFVNAMAGVVIAYNSTNGSGFSTYAGIGGTRTGEYGHLPLIAETAGHTHAPGGTSTSFAGEFPPATGTFNFGAGMNNGSFSATASTGGGLAFNVTQPASFFNIFMKL